MNCREIVKQAGGGALTDAEVDQLIVRYKNLADERALKKAISTEMALKEIAGELIHEEKAAALIQQRNELLTIKSKRRIKDFAGRFPTVGEGLIAFMEGSSKTIEGARYSVDYQAKALHGKYFGRMVADMEEAGVLDAFIKNESELDIFREMEQISQTNGKPGITKNPEALKIAQIIESVTSEMVARQNQAGAYIKKIPGYITRQTHDTAAIRRAGEIEGAGNASKEASFNAWYNFVLPLIDKEKTFGGVEPRSFLRNVHEGLYSGSHGPMADELEVSNIMLNRSLASKVSSSRVLHFAGADAAYKYNQEFGIKNLRDQVFSDLHYRSRNISMMENFGPSPKTTFEKTVNELRQLTRQGDDAAKQIDSLNSWQLNAAFNELSGANDIPANYTLNRALQTGKIVVQMSKMGGVVLSSIGDKAFLQTEMAYQGISHLKTLVSQITGLAKRGPEALKTLRMMGVAMDGLMGNTMARFTQHSTVSGFAHRAQQKFFDLNFMNWWNDVHKSTVAELMSNHLAENADLPMSADWYKAQGKSGGLVLPEKITRVLNLYEIGAKEWDALRSTVWSRDDGHSFITPDKVNEIPVAQIDALVESKGLKVTEANRNRVRDDLETKLRAYYVDRIDIAVPTPGIAEKRWTTFNTQAGTPLGETMRMLMLFKSFPITIMSKVLGREIYGSGDMTFKHWLKSNHKGKMRIAQLIALTTVGGYISGAIRDTLKGKTPKPLFDEKGGVNTATLNEAALRGGGLGLMGDLLFNEYDRSYKSFLNASAGPILGQLDPMADMASKLKHGENISADAGKFFIGNTPYINLFYIRPALDYLILWNIQEFLAPGSMERMERNAEANGQKFFVSPAERTQ